MVLFDAKQLERILREHGFTVPETHAIEVFVLSTAKFDEERFVAFAESKIVRATSAIFYTKDGSDIICVKFESEQQLYQALQRISPNRYYAEPAIHYVGWEQPFFVGYNTIAWKHGWLVYKGNQDIYFGSPHSWYQGDLPHFRFLSQRYQVRIFAPVTFWGIPELAYKVYNCRQATRTHTERKICYMFFADLTDDVTAIVHKCEFVVGRREDLIVSWDEFEASKWLFMSDSALQYVNEETQYDTVHPHFEVGGKDISYFVPTFNARNEVLAMTDFAEAQYRVMTAVFVPQEIDQYSPEFITKFVRNEVSVSSRSVYFITQGYIDVGNVAITRNSAEARQYADDRELTFEQIVEHYNKPPDFALMPISYWHGFGSYYPSVIPLFRGVIFACNEKVVEQMPKQFIAQHENNMYRFGWLTDFGRGSSPVR